MSDQNNKHDSIHNGNGHRYKKKCLAVFTPGNGARSDGTFTDGQNETASE